MGKKSRKKSDKPKKPFSFRRFALKLLCKVLAVVLLLMLGITWLYTATLGRVQYLHSPGQAGGLLWEAKKLFSFVDAVPAMQTGEEKPVPIGGEASGLVNILLIGQDHRPGESGSRSDAMILCTVNEASGKLVLTSFLRDMYVQIPGHGENRLNAAYALGGMELLKETLRENLGVIVDGCVEVDFSRFAELVDLLGGVQIELRQDEAELLNQTHGTALSAGVQQLDGPQALTYSRIRSLDPDGDFSRTDRQRKVLTALLLGAKNTGPVKLIPQVPELLSMLTTDLSRLQVLRLAKDVAPQLKDLALISFQIPAEGTFESQTISEMAVLVVDFPENNRILAEILGTEY